MNIDQLQPGRELDELIATKVMGWTKSYSPALQQMAYYQLQEEGFYQGVKAVEVFNPSTNISDAWQVVEKLRDEGYKIVLESKLFDGWYAYVKNDIGGNITGLLEFETAPEAICKASLKAILGGESE